MTAPVTDRDMLARVLAWLETAVCCDFFACPGNRHRPVPMATCTTSQVVWELRRYLERHGGWCPEHEQHLDRCHSPEDRPAALGYHPVHHPGQLCYCAPVTRDRKGQVIPGPLALTAREDS